MWLHGYDVTELAPLKSRWYVVCLLSSMPILGTCLGAYLNLCVAGGSREDQVFGTPALLDNAQNALYSVH